MAASAAALAAPAAAETYAATGIQVRNAAAVVTVIAQDRADLDVTIAPGAGLPAPHVRVEGAQVVIDGGLENRIRGCREGLIDPQSVMVTGVGWVRREELPSITIRAPRTLDFASSGAVFAEIAASEGGDLRLGGCGDAAVGSAAGALRLSQQGSGDVRVGPVAGELQAGLQGSGALRFASAGADARISLQGSGDIDIAFVTGDATVTLDGSGALRVGPVGGDARAVLNGSGGLSLGDVGGALDATRNGSGGLRVGAVQGGGRIALAGSGSGAVGVVRGGLSAETNGSGDLTIAGVYGPRATLHVDGSGNLTVRDGQVELLEANSDGSGNLRYGGAAGRSMLALRRSGDIAIAEAGRVESLVDRGSGDVDLGR
jgi:hypothetical protein